MCVCVLITPETQTKSIEKLDREENVFSHFHKLKNLQFIFIIIIIIESIVVVRYIRLRCISVFNSIHSIKKKRRNFIDFFFDDIFFIRVNVTIMMMIREKSFVICMRGVMVRYRHRR